MQFGRGVAQDQHARAHRDERDQRAHRGEVGEQVQREHCGEDRDAHAGDHRVDVRRAVLGMDAVEHLRQQAVARHDHEDARLRDDHHQDHRRQADQRADFHHGAQPTQLHVALDGGDHRLAGTELGIRSQARQHGSHREIEDGADHQRDERAEGKVALRVLAFLRRGRRRLEADVGEEHHRRTAHDAGPAVLAGPLVVRDERMPVGRIDVAVTGDHHDDDQADLEAHHQHVQTRRLADADVAEPGQRKHDRHRRQIHDVAGGHQMPIGEGQWSFGKGLRKMDAELVEQAGEIARPTGCHRRRGDAVLQHHVPADEPGHQLTQRGVRVGIGAAGDRDQRGEFGVAQRGEAAADRREDEGDQHRRTGVFRGGLAGHDEDAGADDGADAEGRDAPWSERAAQGRAVAGVVGVGEVGLAGK